ncbi:protein of unknown function [Paraburkholderia kururiensis]
MILGSGFDSSWRRKMVSRKVSLAGCAVEAELAVAAEDAVGAADAESALHAADGTTSMDAVNAADSVESRLQRTSARNMKASGKTGDDRRLDR